MATTPNENDVLFGVSKFALNHSGNHQFRSIVETRKNEYYSAGLKEKRQIAIEIIHQINSMDPPGRFLTEDPNNKKTKKSDEVGLWVPVEEKKATSKVLHRLREYKPVKATKNDDETEESPVDEVQLRKQYMEQIQMHAAAAEESILGQAKRNSLSCKSHPESRHVSSPLVENDGDAGRNAKIPLKDWIAKTIRSTSMASNCSQLSNTTLTDSYITSALQIAHSLADQICSQRDNTGGISPFLTPPGCEWVDMIVVHRDDQLGSGIQFDSGGGFKAELLPVTASFQNGGKSYSETEIIYWLGLVLYELFSGGTRAQFGANGATTAASPPLELVGGLSISSTSPNTNSPVDSERNFCSDLSGNNDIGNGYTSDDAPSQGKRGKQSKTSALSVETLKMRGLPTSLCSLIGNMIDCANGELSGDEAYRHLTDVRSDLQLMINKPSKFLYDLDMTRLFATRLDLSNTIYGQQKELSSLKEWYQRPWMQNDEFAIIAGPSGSGKTVLANQFAQIVTASGGVFLRGKFDQFQQATPFPAIASAFNEYCNILVSSGDPHDTKTILKLNQSLKHDASYLAKVIPNLSLIFGGGDAIDDVDDCVDAQKRLRYLLHRFVEIISSTAVNPIVVFLDDLQWVDAASVSILHQLILASRYSQFFFLGSYREDEVGNDHPITNMIANVCNMGMKSQTISISPMDKDSVNNMISELLCLSPRLTRTLSEVVHHKTKGNPLFVSRLMTSLSKEGLLHLSLGRRRWEWDEEKIQERKIPDDVAEFLTGTIGRLPTDVQAALQTLSCFGASADISVIRVLESGMGLQLQSALDVAVSEAFLDKVDNKYRFSHDKVQESAYNMVNQDGRKLFHSQFGIVLCSHAIANEQDDAILFVAVDQINRAGPSVIMDSEQGSLMASLNLKAGSKAMDMSDFASGLSFLESGMAFLWANHWRDNYDLSLKLFEKAATCSYAIGDHEKLESYSEKILLFANSLDDKMNVIYLSVVTLCDSSKLAQSIEKCLQVLSQLGEDLSTELSRIESLALIESTRSMLNSFSNDDLLSYRVMTDHSKITVMKFLRLLANSTSLIKQSLYPLVTVKMVEFSLMYGMTPISAVGFTFFGGMLATLGHVREGYRLANLAKALVRRFNSKEVAGEVIAMSTQIIGYVEPWQSTIETHSQGYNVSMEADDTRHASMNNVFRCVTLFSTGTKLDFVKKQYEEAHSSMKQHNQLSYLIVTLPQVASIAALMGTEDSTLNEDPNSPQVQQKEKLLREHNPFGAMLHYSQKMYVMFIFRQYEAMKGYAEKYIVYNSQPWIVVCANTPRTFITGLVAFWIYRRSKDSEWYNRGVQFKDDTKQWASSSDWNYQHKLHLLEAEEQYCNGHFESATSSYDKAIALAKKHRFLSEEALSCELAGHFFLETGKIQSSMEYFARAHEKYHEWGAFHKATKLFEFISSIPLAAGANVVTATPHTVFQNGMN